MDSADSATAARTAPHEEWHEPRAKRRPVHRFSAWLAALLLAGVSTVIGFRIADSDGVTPVPQILAFLPWLIAPAVAGLLLAALARWRVGLVWGVVVLGGVAWFMEPYGKTDDPEGHAVAEIRVMASNVQFGRATQGLLKAVRKEKPDLLFVPECDYSCSDTLRDELPRSDYPYRTASEAGGAEGSVIVSKLPLKKASGLAGTLGMPGAVAELKNGHQVRVQLAHPMPPLPKQLSTWRTELAGIRDYAAEGRRANRSTIIAGDFNATQDHAAFRDILDTGGVRDAARLAGSARTPSWPADLMSPLGTQIDHVLLTPDFSARDARFLEIGHTDHRALVVDVTLHGTDR
ncbi:MULTISPECIES: endonuclease/exonuclease/phosphatase family protein [unclassified Streptomyces]|uniref:endonuclease/exonuclease/phosphatase family protein n=1 Tax=unclassified Streptomyces TaxID=2593676 RepID=UPI00365F17E0